MILKKLFFKSDVPFGLGAQDFAVLDVYRTLGPRSACAADVYLHLQEALGRDPRLPTIYKIVSKLSGLGLLREMGEAPSHGGRPRTMFRLTPDGERALRLADRMIQRSGGADALVPA